MKYMYRLFMLLLALVSSTPVWANNPPDDSLRVALDRVFELLDKTQIPAPYLQEYGYKFASLQPFDGTLTDSSRTTLALWRQLYISLQSGSINGPNNLPDLGTLNNELATQLAASGRAIPLIVQRINYASLRPDAVQAGLLTESNGRLQDVPGRLESPYLRRTLFAVAAARSMARTGDVSFVFKRSLYAQSGGGNVSGLSIDFNDGRGYIAAAWDQPVTAAYYTAGTRRVKVRISYSDNVMVQSTARATTRVLPPQIISYESHFDLEVFGPDYTAGRYDVPELRQPFAPRPGVHSGGMVHVRFGSNRTNTSLITRPLIVAEGYDGYSVAPSVYQENFGIEDFMTLIRNGGIRNQLENAGDPGFPAPVGYDIVFIDYNNGTDDIRRNAALFREVVAWVNANKAGGTATGQQNVVLGVSMGGLVARYGLAQMEKAQPGSTHTRLLVTHDSPHRGANTPLGVQALTRQSSVTLAASVIRIYNSSGLPVFVPALRVFPEIQEADNLLDAPATQQLLLVRATRTGVGRLSVFGHEFNSFLDGDYRAMITPSSGQTFPYTFVATSLGSECGQELFAPHTELIRVAGRAFFSGPSLGGAFNTEIIVNALPNGGQRERLSSLRIWTQVKVLGIQLPRIYFSNLSYHSPADNRFAWDGLPGGTQPISGQGGFSPSNGSFWYGIFGLSAGANWQVRLADDFCFVPRASALDVAVLDNESLRGQYANGIGTGSASQASRFLGQAKFIDSRTSATKFNFTHPRFPARQAQWMFNELQQQPQPSSITCTSECSPFEISSSLQRPCPGVSVDFSATNVPYGTTVNWSVQGGTTASGTGVTFTTAPLTTSESLIVRATIVNSAGCSLTRTLTLPVGKVPPQPTEPICGTYSYYNSNYFSTASVPGATSYRWTEHNGNLAYQVQSTSPYPSYSLRTVTAYDWPNTITLTVEAMSDCGTGPASAPATVEITGSGAAVPLCAGNRTSGSTAPTSRVVATYPNPTRGGQDLTLHRTTAADNANSPLQLRLYDAYSRLRWEGTLHAADQRVSTAGLAPGIYFLHVAQHGQVLDRQQIEIHP